MVNILTHKPIKLIAGPARIKKLIEKLAKQILQAHPELSDVVLVGIRCGGVPVTNRIREIFFREKNIDIPTGYLDITLYRDDWTRISQYPEVKRTEIPFSIEDKNVILVDDVIYTGRTVRAAMDALMDMGRPRKIELAVLVDRGGRELPIEPTYSALRIKRIAPYDYVSVYFKELHGRDQICLERK